MKEDEFLKMVDEHEDMRGIAIERGNDGVDIFVVEHMPSRLVTVVPSCDVIAFEWGLLESVMGGEREPNVLDHMTRVVGYYSKKSNWNPSKLGELKDRQNGNYTLPRS